MPLPDPYWNESAVELDPETYKLWLKAKEAAEGWEKEAGRLRDLLAEQLGNAHAGLLNGEKVVTYRPTARYAEARLKTAYPDLVQHFMRKRQVDFFDVALFAAKHPDIAEQYRSRSFRMVGE